MHPSVSVIVPTYNRRNRLQRLLQTLEQVRPQVSQFEVVVAVDGANDGTREMLAAIESAYPLRVVEQANQGPAAARNNAISVASGEVLLFLDDDVVPAPGLIERHLEVHARDSQAVVIGAMLAPPGLSLTPWLRWEAAMVKKQYDAMTAGEWAPTPRQFYTANASVRRDHALAAGGFDPRFTRAEDVEFAFRLGARGLRFYFEPDARVFHEPDRTFEGWLRVPYEYGKHDVRMARDCDLAWMLELAYSEWKSRHVLNRLLPRLCVGHPIRLRLANTMFSHIIRNGGRLVPNRLHMILCSALFTLQYWQGIADATELDHRVWQGVRDGSATQALRMKKGYSA